MIKQRSLATYIILTFLTCGIYSIFFWYSYTEDVNAMCRGDGEESMNYILVLLLSIVTCGIYGLYWFYKQANRLRKAGPRYGVAIAEGGGEFQMWYLVGCLICFVGSFLSFNVLIKNANLIADVYNRQNGGPTPPPYGGTAHKETSYGASADAADNKKEDKAGCFCARCGEKMYVTDRFCPQCGARNERAADAGYAGPQANSGHSKNAGNSQGFRQAGAGADILGFLSGGRLTAIVSAVAAGLLVIDRLWSGAGFFTMFSMIEYMLPALCIAVFGVLCFLDRREYRQYEIVPLIPYFGLLFLSGIRVSGITPYTSYSWIWDYYSAFDNFCSVILALAALAAVGCLVMELAGKRYDIVLLAAVIIIFGITLLTGVVTLFTQFRYWGFPGIYSFFTLFASVVSLLPMLLYVLQRNPQMLDKLKK